MKTIEEEVASVLATICHRDRVSLLDELVRDLGVDSLSFVQLVVALEQRTGVSFDDEDLMLSMYPTVADLARYLARRANPSEATS
ncbi:acyl carrier protein [Parasulfuritortus cantonensis]|uniref:Acyl carrier protein n=1 Tax=Parasulfuritortus cantonensis TaxID=2528202 RepID=A0A4R1BDU5_9PROT|nr:acyl carrier protein [Parasulfuritortus cantonensis]TCJ15217.1 acyl carrier protein [Parasulfuritortus cantonensis]